MSKRNRDKRKFIIQADYIQYKGELPYSFNLETERQSLINKQYFAQVNWRMKVTEAKYQRLVKLAKYQRFVDRKANKLECL